ncbi:hypothetical protein JCM10213_002022 [Rhodosporidiobolus nylandii]
MPAAASEYLFDAALIPENVRAAPTGLTLRPLASSDYSRGHLSLLAHLTSSPDVGQQTWSTRFDELAAVNKVQLTYLNVVLVEEESDELVGQATVVLERKFLRNAGLVGHIEDVVVDPRMQGKKLGLRLLEVLTALSESLGAYKTILDCDPKNEAFYVKCGYENKGCEMAKYAKK